MSEEKDIKSTGTTMLVLTWICALVLLSALFTEWLNHQENPNQSPSGSSNNVVNEVVLQANRKHHYVTNGFINNQEVVFLLDTGATHVAIPADLAKRLGLKAGRKDYAQTANGITETYNTMIDELKLGTITLYDVRASITMGMTGDGILLGMSALKDIEFTQRNGELILRQYR